MNVKPTRWFDGSLKMPIYVPDGGGLVIECTVTAPPSSEGRKAWLFLDRRDVDQLLLEFREEAIHARSTPLPTGATGSSEGFT